MSTTDNTLLTSAANSDRFQWHVPVGDLGRRKANHGGCLSIFVNRSVPATTILVTDSYLSIDLNQEDPDFFHELSLIYMPNAGKVIDVPINKLINLLKKRFGCSGFLSIDLWWDDPKNNPNRLPYPHLSLSLSTHLGEYREIEVYHYWNDKAENRHLLERLVLVDTVLIQQVLELLLTSEIRDLLVDFDASLAARLQPHLSE